MKIPPDTKESIDVSETYLDVVTDTRANSCSCSEVLTVISFRYWTCVLNDFIRRTKPANFLFCAMIAFLGSAPDVVDGGSFSAHG